MQPLTSNAETPGVSIQVSRDTVVASIQVDLDEDVLARFREELLQRIHATGSRGVILDVSGLETLDSEEFTALRDIMAMAEIMGAEAVLAGLRPGVVSALIESRADVNGVRAALDLDAAFALLQFLLEPVQERDEDAAPEANPEDSNLPPPSPTPAAEP